MKHITDSVHGGIQIKDELIKKLIKTKEFIRLSRISHLGTTNAIYPMATHTRLEHSLGVYELARRALNKLEQDISPTTHRAILAAGLLHDLGHGPFSHSFEKVSDVSHEEYTIAIIESDSEVSDVFDEIDPAAKAETIQIIKGEHKLPWANQLISSEIDIDRLDYLLRDSLNAGVPYGTIDISWLFKNINVIDNNLVWDYKALPALEEVIMARYQMGQTVYKSEKSKAFNQLFIFFINRMRYLYKNNELKGKYECMVPLLENRRLTNEEFYHVDDPLVYMLAKKAGKAETDKILRKILKHIANNKIPEIIDRPTQEQIDSMNNDEKGMSWTVVEVNKDIRTFKAHGKSEAKILLKDKTISPITDESTIFKNIFNSDKDIQNKDILVKLK